MKKNISYRDKLLELAQIYKVQEILNYKKNKKYLTTSQIEHLLKKNNVPIPTEINKSLLEIHSKKITKPISSAGEAFTDFFKSGVKGFINLFFSIIKNIGSLISGFFNGILKICSWISKTTVNILNNVYNFEVEEKRANKFVSGFVAISFIGLIIIGAFQVRNIMLDKNFFEAKKEVVEKKEKSSSQKKPKEVIKPKQETKKAEKKKPKADKQEKVVKEFILPDLNLKTETVLSLFDDVEYDLKKVRREKLVKPIYFTQFPKDLDEISSTQLKKETFIKIVLPLVVAENEKILDDRNKLKRIIAKKVSTDKDKSWIRQKIREYKVTNGKMEELEKRMDIIPVSIAIAQAAKESGWGTSRFALEGNAIFGQWTWTGKGIEPLDKTKGSHKVLRFPILRASVKAYKKNLNTHKSYKEFREIRAKLRKKRKSVNGIKLIHSLDNYAETGSEYTKILEQIIEQNSLEDFEKVRLTNSVVKKQLNL